MKKIFKIMVVTCLTLCMFSMSQVSALDDESDLIERCFNGQTMIIHNGKDVTDVVKEKYKSEYANKNFDTIIEDFEKNNYDFITQDDGNGIKPRASSTVLNGYYWETYYNSIRSKVFVYAQVTYNANTGAYMSRTKALGKFSVKGSNKHVVWIKVYQVLQYINQHLFLMLITIQRHLLNTKTEHIDT